MSEAPVPRRVAVVAKRSSREALLTARELVEWLQRRGCEVMVEPATAAAQPELAPLAHPLQDSAYDPADAFIARHQRVAHSGKLRHPPFPQQAFGSGADGCVCGLDDDVVRAGGNKAHLLQ